MITNIPVVGAIALLWCALPVLAEAPAHLLGKPFETDRADSPPVSVSIDAPDRLPVREVAALQDDPEGFKPEENEGMKRLNEKIPPLMEAKEFAKAIAEIDAVLKAHPEIPDDEVIAIQLGVGLALRVEMGDVDAALKHVDTVLKAHPDCELAPHAELIKESVKKSMKEKAAEKDEEKSAGEGDSK